MEIRTLTRMVETHPLCKLSGRVPMHEQCHHTRPGTTLAEAQEEAYGVYLLSVMGRRNESW
jgi:hypothetical protein